MGKETVGERIRRTFRNLKTEEAFRDFGKFLFGAAAWNWMRSNITLRDAAKYVVRNSYNFLLKLPWVVAIIVVAAILIQGLTEHVIVIQPISVPDELSKSGYTPEVAAYRLHDALTDFVKAANSHMASPEIALQGDLPDIVVPSVGISLDAIMASIRTLLRSTRSRTISGEFTIVSQKIWLRLRLDSQQLYSSVTGGDLNNPDALFKDAAETILRTIQPYYVAAYLNANGKPNEALALANSIISRYPESDQNVVWSYILKGNVLRVMKKYPEATDALNTALRINPSMAAAHIDLGAILEDQNNKEEALDEFRNAAKIDQTFDVAHYDIGVVLDEIGIQNRDEAIAEFRLAIKYNSDYADAYIRLANDLHAENIDGEAFSNYREAIRANPTYALAYDNFGIFLNAINKKDEAIKEFQAALKNNASDAIGIKYLNQLGVQVAGVPPVGSTPTTSAAEVGAQSPAAAPAAAQTVGAHE